MSSYFKIKISSNIMLLITVLNIFIEIKVQAFELFGTAEKSYESTIPELKKYVDFIKKDARCEIAIVTISRPKVEGFMTGVISVVRCIGGVVFSKGTINEKSGCAAFYLNQNTLDVKPFNQNGFYQTYFNFVENKSCKDSFIDLLNQKTVRRSNVEKFLLRDQGSFPIIKYEPVLIYSSQKYFTDWYVKEKINFEKEAKEEYQDAKKSDFKGYDPKPKEPITVENTLIEKK